MTDRKASLKARLLASAAGTALCGLTGSGRSESSSEPSCQDWNTRDFFEMATEDDVSRCLNAGADIEARDELGWTPLHWAAHSSDSPAVVKALLDADANLEAKDELGWTPMNRAALFSDSPAVVKALLDAGATICDTPLHRAAAFSESPGAVKDLLNDGANLEARDELGATPLHWAARFSESPAVVKALL
ncbi:ankyrin repeat domain-containing protein, partial [Candidatus Synechococcus spongiarum]